MKKSVEELCDNYAKILKQRGGSQIVERFLQNSKSDSTMFDERTALRIADTAEFREFSMALSSLEATDLHKLDEFKEAYHENFPYQFPGPKYEPLQNPNRISSSYSVQEIEALFVHAIWIRERMPSSSFAKEFPDKLFSIIYHSERVLMSFLRKVTSNESVQSALFECLHNCSLRSLTDILELLNDQGQDRNALGEAIINLNKYAYYPEFCTEPPSLLIRRLDNWVGIKPAHAELWEKCLIASGAKAEEVEFLIFCSFCEQ